MSDRLTLRWLEPVQAYASMRDVLWVNAKALMLAGHRLVVELMPEGQTRDQQKLYHAIIGDIATQAQHLGATWEAEDWKRLLLDSFAKETGKARGRIIPNLTGDGVVEVGLLSRRFSKSTASEFTEWLMAWCSEHGVELRDARQWSVDLETGEIL